MTTATPLDDRHRQKVILLPVAPQAVARSRFAESCQKSQAMSPEVVLAWLQGQTAHEGEIGEVELAGPGDPLATPQITFAALNLLRKHFPGLALSVTTLGITGDEQAETLAALGVTRLTLLMDAVDTEIVQRLYLWIRPARRTIPLSEAAMILLSEQATAIAAMRRAGIAVTIRTTVYPGFNDDHVEEVARQAASLGAESMVIVPGLPSVIDEKQVPAPGRALMHRVREAAAKHLPVVDANDSYGSGLASQPASVKPGAEVMIPRPSGERPNVAVVSSNGMEVDLHLGQATCFMVYGPREDGLVSLLATRPAPAAGGGAGRWERLADVLSDCFALLVASAGDTPTSILKSRGLPLLVTDGEIGGTVDVLFGGGKQSKGRTQRHK